MSKILITGGAGYVGSMLCTKLLQDGHSVTTVDLLKYDKSSLNHLYFFKKLRFIKTGKFNPNAGIYKPVGSGTTGKKTCIVCFFG